MKKIFTALMLVASVFTVSARELHADLSQATKAGPHGMLQQAHSLGLPVMMPVF